MAFVDRVKGVNFEPLREEENQEDMTCGLGPFRPKWLQGLATAKVFLVCYCALGILQGAYFTYTVGIVSTIEKRFAFDSKTSGLILIADNLSPIFTSPLIGFFGAKANRPRIIGFGTLFVVFSCFISAAPYFIYGPGLHLLSKDLGKINVTLCRADDILNLDQACAEGNSGHFATLTAVVFFFVGSFFSGFGGSAYYTAGIPYLDDNVKKADSAGYFSLSMSIRLFGPSLGFALASFCLHKFESPSLAPNISTTDPRFVGAWWLGFVILGVCLFIFSIPMLFFPRRLRKPPVTNKEKDQLPKLKDMPKSLMKLMKNAIFMAHALGLVFRMNGLLGYFVLMPRFMEAHFHQSASSASVISGTTSIISMLFGIFAGGIVIRRFKPRPRYLTGYMVLVHAVTLASFFTVMFFACEPMKMGHPRSSDGMLSVYGSCNTDCGCSMNVFQPACGSDSATNYFSPCHAGCSGAVPIINSTKMNFTGCECSLEPSDGIQQLTEGLCPFTCNMFVSYILVLSVAKLISSTGSVGNMLINLRCVAQEEKALAVGVSGCMLSALAFIPHPLIFGALADASCQLWEESCGSQGNCWIYDVDKLRFLLHGACVAFIGAGGLCDLVVFLLSGRMKDFYDDVPQEEPVKLGVTAAGKDEEEDEDVLYSKSPMVLGNSFNNLHSGLR